MFLSDKTMRLLVESGLQPEKLVAILQSLREDEEAARPMRSAAAERQARYRTKKVLEASSSANNHNEASPRYADVTLSDESNGCDGGLTPEVASRVVYTKLPSEVVIDTSEPNGSSVDRSLGESVPDHPPEKPSPKSRGTRLPDDWEPTPADIEVARREGLTDEEITRAAREFRNYWTSLAGSKSTKVNWSRTWENRVIERADLKRRHGARLASAPGKPGSGGRGASTFADIYARRHGFVAD